MRKLLLLFTLAALPCFAQTSGTTITQYQVLSFFGLTNQLHTNDLIFLSIRQGTASERPKGILINDFSNLLFSAVARLSDLIAATNRIGGGPIYVDTVNRTNLNGSATSTNLGNFLVPANLLTNLGDSARGEWFGNFANSTSASNQFQITYDGQVILDSGLVSASNGVWQVHSLVTYTGATNQKVFSSLDWSGVSGPPFSITNSTTDLTRTNSVSNLFALKCASRSASTIVLTNRLTRIWFDPGTR